MYLFNCSNGLHNFLSAPTALVGVGLLIVEVSRSHSDTPHKVGLLWTSVRPVEETSALQHTHTQNPNMRQIIIPPRFEPENLVNKRRHTHILDILATGISGINITKGIFRPVALQPVNAPLMSVILISIRHAAHQYKVS